MTDTETVVKFPEPKPRLHCLTCHAEGPAPCDCGSNAKIVTVDKAREHRKADAHARYGRGETQEQIAKEWRVVVQTISNDLADFEFPKNGKSKRSKTESNPKGAGRPKGIKSKPKASTVPPEDEAAIATMVLDEGKTDKQAQAATGWSSTVVRKAVAKERARREAEAHPRVDPATLSMTAQAKLQSAERHMRQRLEAEFAARIRAVDEEVRQRVLTETKEYLAMLKEREAEAEKTQSLYREFMDQQRRIFTAAEFKLVIMCVHADASISPEKRDAVTRLLLSKRFALTGEKQ